MNKKLYMSGNKVSESSFSEEWFDMWLIVGWWFTLIFVGLSLHLCLESCFLNNFVQKKAVRAKA